MANVPDAITRFLIFLLLAVFRFSIVQIFIVVASVVVIAWMAEHARLANTHAINTSSSSSDSKCVLWPDTTCSTRPAIRPCGRSVLVRKCTTNAHWTDKGAVAAWG